MFIASVQFPVYKEKNNSIWYDFDFPYSVQPANPNLCDTILHFT